MFPAYANLLCQLGGKKPIISDVCSSLAASLICACCWEVVAPALLPWSTGDPVDALMYLIGGLIYLAAYKSKKL